MKWISKKRQRGLTMIELIMVVTIISIIVSISTPRAGFLLTRAHQAKAKNNLGTIRSTLILYFADQHVWPLQSYGPNAYASHQSETSLTTLLVPTYANTIPTLYLHDLNPEYNNNGTSYDKDTVYWMNQSIPKEVYIMSGSAGYNDSLRTPLVYDNETGEIYVNNGNLDTAGNFFYTW